MAILSGSINLSFTSNYAGCHRVCWRIAGELVYNCTTQVTCPGGGQACPVIIPIQVDDTLCEDVVYEGYAQACCEDISSPNGQLPFQLTYSPNPDCKGYTITCVGPVTVQSVVYTNPGSAYVPGASIPVNFLGGGGTGAVANAIIGDGGISDAFGAATPFPFGSGYVDGTYYSVPAINFMPVIGGSGALFNVTVLSGQVISAVIVPGSNGTGYNIGDIITFNAANLGGSGSGVEVTINIINTGQVQNVILTNPGSGYTTTPTATIPPSGGIQATLGVIMTGCPTINLHTCSNANYPIDTVPLGTSFVACNNAAYSLPTEYTVVQDQCCSDCNTITLDKPLTYTNPPATVYYQDCVTKAIIATSVVAGGSIGPVCIVAGSLLVVESDPINGSTIIAIGPSC